MVSLSKRLKQLRAMEGLTQLQLAKRAGLTLAYIGRLETEHYDPQLSTLKRLAEALGISTPALLHFTLHNGKEETRMRSRKKWNQQVAKKVKMIKSVLPWLKDIENDPDKYFEWESKKSACQAAHFIELAANEMFNLQYYENERQQKLAIKATKDLSGR